MASTQEMAAEIAANFASNAESPQEILQLLQDTHQTLAQMDGGTIQAEGSQEAEETEKKLEPVMSPKKAIGKDQLTCLVCGKAFKTLKRHLQKAHEMTPQQYRETFGLERDYPLVAPNLSKQRAKVAKERGLGEKLAEARQKKSKGK